MVLHSFPPVHVAYAAKPPTFLTKANGNHWGRSELRAYMNNALGTVDTDGIVTNKNFKLDSTGSTNTSGYAQHFTAAEFGLVKPTTYYTNVLNNLSQSEAASVYETTDNFFLPSGHFGHLSDLGWTDRYVLSWGDTDISHCGQYELAKQAGEQYLIPISYWSRCPDTIYCWLRSPNIFQECVLCSKRGNSVSNEDVNNEHSKAAALAAAFRINLSSVLFASAASAAHLAAGGAQKISISGATGGDSGNYAAFGEMSEKALPSYGMYLKTEADSSVKFNPTALSLGTDSNSKTVLNVTYSDGVAGQNVVVHAFKNDSLTGGTDSYAASALLTSEGGDDGVTVAVPWNNGDASLLSDFTNYTIKVWMEKPVTSGYTAQASLAEVTKPVTFTAAVSNGVTTFIKDTNMAPPASINPRVFAMKNELKCSWGDLDALATSDEAEFNRVINAQKKGGETTPSELYGTAPTNQKIYYGTDPSGNPMEFWIAGREATDHAGVVTVTTDGTGDTMCLYQAAPVDVRCFNLNEPFFYYGNKTNVTLQLEDNMWDVGAEVQYQNSGITATVTYPDGAETKTATIDFSKLKWQYRTPGTSAWTTGMPTTAGTYELRCYLEGNTDSDTTTPDYERTYSSVVTFLAVSDSGIKQNDWRFSDLRWYLNTGARAVGAQTGKALADSTGDANITNARGYASHFTTAEFDMVQASAVSTNTLGGGIDYAVTKTGEPFKTKDRFFLPSAFIKLTSSGQIDSTVAQYLLSWGDKDISLPSTDGSVDISDKRRLIPISYWSRCPDEIYCWLRSPSYALDNVALFSARGTYVTTSYVQFARSVAAAFRINLSSVLFASAASAAHLAAGGAQKISISGATGGDSGTYAAFGEMSEKALPSYGMYLKTANTTDSFNPSALSLSSDKKTLTVTYTGGKIGQHVVVHAFKNDSLTDGTDSYAASALLKSEGGDAGVTVDVPWNNGDASLLSDFTNYTIKVWMEDPGSGVNLAKATTPVTFTAAISNGVTTFTKDTSISPASINPRVFAMKNELKCSWGDLDALATSDEAEFNRVINAKAKGDETTPSGLYGTGPTNQKIYYGTDSSGNPMEFWIAGRESPNGSVLTDGNGDTMCLYQATAVEKRAFKRYDGTPDSPAYQDALTVSGAANSYGCSACGTTDNTKTITLSGGTGSGTATMTTSNSYVATVNASGKVKIKNPGTFEIIATKAGGSLSSTYEEAVRTGPVTVGDHSWGTYSGTNPHTIICNDCSKPYSHKPSSWNSTGDTKHQCSQCNLTAVHSGGTATCTEQALCTFCGVAYGKTLAHKLGSWQHTETSHWKTCSSCQSKIDEANHTWGDWTTTKAATTTEDGQKSRTCSTCGHIETETIPKLTLEQIPNGNENRTITRYVDSNGRTSVELITANLDSRKILWLKEESEGTYAWYGLDLSTGAFPLDQGLRFYVRWLAPGAPDYDEYFSKLTPEQQAKVGGDNGWIFLIGVEDTNGNKVQPTVSVLVYVQIGDDWNLDDLKAYYLGGEQPAAISVDDVRDFPYPEGTDEFGVVTLDHFSPYFIYDEHTDEERAQSKKDQPQTPQNGDAPSSDSNGASEDSPGSDDSNGASEDSPNEGNFITVTLLWIPIILLGFGAWWLVAKKKKSEE